MDIARLIDDEIAGAGGVLSGVLTKTTPGSRTTGSLAGGTNPAKVKHAFRGFLENVSETRRSGGLSTVEGEVLSILGASLPAGVVPEVNDLATLEGIEYEFVALINRDPAAAIYQFRVES